MTTATTNYGFIKPVVGGDRNSWGAELNGTLDQIDSTIFNANNNTLVPLTYQASVIPNCALATAFKIIVTDNVAFAIAAPVNVPSVSGPRITFIILNSSGGAMGALTWNGVFALAGAFTNPANGKRRTISFILDGATWVELYRASADI